MLIDQPIPNFFGGVSQQPPLARFPNQLTEQVNCVADVIEGLNKRPPTEHIKRLINALASKRPAAFTIDRDTAKRFVAIVSGGTVRVFDIVDGTEKTVTGETSGYLATDSAPAASIRALTIADYTFLLNREKTVTRKASHKSAARPHEAIVFVRAGNYGRTYDIKVKRKSDDYLLSAATFAAPDGSAASQSPHVDTTYIATQLYTALDGSFPVDAGWLLSRTGSVIYIRNDTTDFYVEVEDGQGKQALRAFKDAVQRFTDLPADSVREGFVLSVTGDQATAFDDYWVRWNGKTWEETLKPNSDLGFDKATMPLALIHNPDDSFTIQQIDWVERTVGDDDNAPFPSFVDQKINALFYFRDRLGFLSQENAILSQSGDYFNFFRTTMTAELDTDPIDTTAANSTSDSSAVTVLEHAVAFDKRLALFAANGQFILHSNNQALTPGTVTIDPVTSFDTSSTCKPVPVGRFVYFTFDREGASGVRELLADGNQKIEDAPEITAHVPTYLPGGISQLAACTLESFVLALPPSGDAVYSYDYALGDDGKLQSAWGRWQFHPNDDIVSAHVFGNVVYFLVARADGYHWERMRFRPGLTDTGLDYFTRLDRRVGAGKYTAVYSAITDRTTITVPWPVTSNMQVVTARHSTLHAPGIKVPILVGAGYAVQVAGDKTAWNLVVGVPYTQSADFTRPYYVQQSVNGTGANTESQLVMKTFSLDFADAGYFRCIFKPANRPTYTKEFSGRILGATAGSVPPLEDGNFRIKTPTKNKHWALTVENDSPFPSRFLAGSWRGLVESKSRHA